MILFDTPNETALKVMLSEWEKVCYFVRKTDDKVKKHFQSLKPGQLHLFIQKYTIPTSKNTYYVISRKDFDDNINTWTYLKAYGESGKTKFYILRRNVIGKAEELFEKPVWILDIYTGHFLSRYRQRTGATEKSTDELFIQFLQQNNEKGMAIPASMVNPAAEGKNQYAIVSDEGLAFVDSQEYIINGALANINENKTFVSRRNLYYKQAESIVTTDYYLKYMKLHKAKRSGASADTMMKIINSGFFDVPQK